MKSLNQLVQRYEDMEKNKAQYLQYRKHYENLIENNISNHDLCSLDSVIHEFMDLNRKNKKALITSDLNRIEHIKDAIHEEYKHNFPLFWDNIFNIHDLIAKYDKTIFMLRRLLFDLPESYKSESLIFLMDISPFIIEECYKDVTSLVGKEDFIYITLAMEHIKSKNYQTALIFLKNVKNQYNEIKPFILHIESLINNSGDKNE